MSRETLKFYLVTAVVGVYEQPGRRVRKTYATVAANEKAAMEQARSAMLGDHAVATIPAYDEFQVEQKHSPFDLANVWVGDGRAR